MALPDTAIKVVLLGDTGVGKSSLALRFANNEFRAYSESTIGASFMTKKIEVASQDPPEADSRDQHMARMIEFKIWDTAGQEKYQSLAPMYYRGAAAAIVVYDISSASSFHTLKKWIDEIRTNGPPSIVIAICGNKSDLTVNRSVPRDMAVQYTDQIGGFYIETSARDDSNVNQLFEEIANRVTVDEERDLVTKAEEGVGGVSLGTRRNQMRKGCC